MPTAAEKARKSAVITAQTVCMPTSCGPVSQQPLRKKPVTGFFRNGGCDTSPDDLGSHTVCAVMTAEFLAYSRSVGNDLSTPRPDLGFPGLKPGDRLCLCAPRWKEALDAGAAPRVVLECTHEETLAIVTLGVLKDYAVEA